MARSRTRIPPSEALTQKGRLKRLPGKKYLDTKTGITYTYRGVQTARSGQSPEAAARSTKLARAGVFPAEENVEHLLKRYQQAAKARGEKSVSKKAAYTEGSDFLKALADLQTKGTGHRSKKARALVTLGLRSDNARYRVGESPKADKGTKLPPVDRQRISRRERVTGRR